MHYKIFSVRLSDEEYEELYERSQAAGLKRSEYFRRCVLPRPINDPDIAKALGKLVNEINKIGVNINQVVKKIHETGESQADILELKSSLKRVSSLLSEVRDYCYNKNSTYERRKTE